MISTGCTPSHPPSRCIAFQLGGRHLRLAWVDSPPDPTQGWAGHRGPARVRVDTALRAQDPAVLIMPGPVVGARDPVVDLLACAIPPHFVQPWATVEVVRDSDGDDAGDSSEGLAAAGGRKEGALPQTAMSGAGRGGGDATSTLLRRPEAVLELLRGCAVETGSVIYLLPAPTDAVCRGIRLLCRRAPEFVIPPLLTFSPETSAASRCGGGGETTGGGRRSSKKGSSSGRPRESGRPLGGGEGAAGEELEAGVGKRGGAPVRGPTRDRGDTEKGRPTRAAMADEVGTDVRQPRHAPAAATSNGRERGEGGQSAEGGGGDWASRLSKWGVVTTCSEIVTPHKALEVWYHDVAVAAAAAAATAATAVAATTAGREGAEDVMTGFCPDFIWIRVVLLLERAGRRPDSYFRGHLHCWELLRLQNLILVSASCLICHQLRVNDSVEQRWPIAAPPPQNGTRFVCPSRLRPLCT